MHGFHSPASPSPPPPPPPPPTRLGIQALPYVARVPPSLPISEGGAVTIAKEDILSAAGYPWSAEDIAAFVLDRTGVPVGEIQRTSLISKRLMPVVSLLVLGALGWGGFQLYQAPFMRQQWIYAVGALFVYWFSTSGAAAAWWCGGRRYWWGAG